MDLVNLLWLFILASLQPALQRRFLELSRQRALSRLASERGSTVVTLIHRQETMSFLGFPLVRYINIDDAEGVLGTIRSTPSREGARSPWSTRPHHPAHRSADRDGLATSATGQAGRRIGLFTEVSTEYQ